MPCAANSGCFARQQEFHYNDAYVKAKNSYSFRTLVRLSCDCHGGFWRVENNEPSKQAPSRSGGVDIQSVHIGRWGDNAGGYKQ